MSYRIHKTPSPKKGKMGRKGRGQGRKIYFVLYFPPLCKDIEGTIKIALQVKVIAAKPDAPSSTPRTHTMERERPSLNSSSRERTVAHFLQPYTIQQKMLKKLKMYRA